MYRHSTREIFNLRPRCDCDVCAPYRAKIRVGMRGQFDAKLLRSEELRNFYRHHGLFVDRYRGVVLW